MGQGVDESIHEVKILFRNSSRSSEISKVTYEHEVELWACIYGGKIYHSNNNKDSPHFKKIIFKIYF